jgi:hypothetical protein
MREYRDTTTRDPDKDEAAATWSNPPMTPGIVIRVD